VGKQRSIGSIVDEPARIMEDGQGAVRVFMDVDCYPHEVLPVMLLALCANDDETKYPVKFRLWGS